MLFALLCFFLFFYFFDFVAAAVAAAGNWSSPHQHETKIFMNAVNFYVSMMNCAHDHGQLGFTGRQHDSVPAVDVDDFGEDFGFGFVSDSVSVSVSV